MSGTKNISEREQSQESWLKSVRYNVKTDPDGDLIYSNVVNICRSHHITITQLLEWFTHSLLNSYCFATHFINWSMTMKRPKDLSLKIE